MNLQSSDQRKIYELIDSQFESVNWGHGKNPDWQEFEKGFLPFAQLFSSARPARPQSARDFVSRLQKLREEGTLSDFSEKGVGKFIFIVGNVAVALAGCEMTENKNTITRDISVFLLVKQDDNWRIVSQAWDYTESIIHSFSNTGLRV